MSQDSRRGDADAGDQAAEQIAEQSTSLAAATDGSPRFGRLLLVLIFAVLLIVVITFASEAYFS